MKVRNIPVLLIVGFNLLTILIYALHPFKTLNDSNLFTVCYLLLNVLCVYKGFQRGVVRKPAHITGIADENRYLSKIISFVFVFYILTFTLRYAYELYCPPFDIPALVRRIILGLKDASWGYRTKGVQSIPWTLYFLISIVDEVFFVFCFLSWKRLDRLKKCLFVILVLFEVLFWFGKGTNFGLIIIILNFLFSYMASYRKKHVELKNTFKFLILVIFLFFICILVFSRNLSGRMGQDIRQLSFESNSDMLSYMYIDDDNAVLNFLPGPLKPVFILISSYLTQGYCALSYAFSCPFEWGFFLSNTPASVSLVGILGIDLSQFGYQLKLEHLYGIDPLVCWHSIYVWLANDFTFWGVPIVMYLIGKMMGAALHLYRNYHDILSGVIFVFFANMLTLSFANNNYLSSIFYSFMFLFPIWLKTRYLREPLRKHKIRSKTSSLTSDKH